MKTNWQPVILGVGEGEKLIFDVGMVTIKVPCAMTDNSYFCWETLLPPGAGVQQHSHPEAEMFYFVEGTFEFYLSDMDLPISATPGMFINVPPHELHAYSCVGDTVGKILGMATPSPGGANGLETFLRRICVAVEKDEQVPDFNQPLEKIQESIANLRE